MTTQNTTTADRPDRPAHPADAAAPPRPYAPPSLTALGSIGGLTAGPDQRPEKTLDQLFGGTGGFAQADATS